MCFWLTIVCAFFGCAWKPIYAADDANAAARATLERIQALRKARPGGDVLVFYESLVRSSLGEHQAPLDLLQSLKGRKLGLIPTSDSGFDALWDDPAFQKIRKELADEEEKTPNCRCAIG